jgi:hypothetical protein
VSDIIGTLLTTPRHPLAASALPGAPIVEEFRRTRAPRRALAAALRGLGRGSRRFADRVEPAPHPGGQCATA